jgi:hypothetical protein
MHATFQCRLSRPLGRGDPELGRGPPELCRGAAVDELPLERHPDRGDVPRQEDLAGYLTVLGDAPDELP